MILFATLRYHHSATDPRPRALASTYVSDATQDLSSPDGGHIGVVISSGFGGNALKPGAMIIIISEKTVCKPKI